MKFDTVRIVSEDTRQAGATRFRYYLEKRYWWFPIWHYAPGTMSYSESETRWHYNYELAEKARIKVSAKRVIKESA